MSHFFTNYGMLGVLLLLCIFCSWATLKEQYPRGEEAGAEVAAELTAADTKVERVMIVAGETAADGLFVDRLTALMDDADVRVVATVQGAPSDVRRAFEASAAGDTPDAIATTHDHLRIVKNIKSDFPGLSDTTINVPPSYYWPTFLLSDNLMNVARQIVVIAVIAVGMTMVIITGGIDLSVGSMIALSAVIAALLIEKVGGGTDATAGAMFLSCFAAVLACGLVGAFSGTMITVFRIPPFIATLAMMQIVSGLAYIFSRGTSIYKLPDSFVWLGRMGFGIGSLVIPYAVVLMLIIYVLAHVLMSKTTLGRYIYAVGGNAEAARLSGVRVKLVLLFAYAVSGLMAGLGGVVMASELKSGSPTYGLMYELYVIASVVVGGASLSGGEGRIMGTLIGAFIIAVIRNGMNLMHVESYTQKVVLGAVILGAVLLDRLRKREWRRPSSA